MTNVEEGVPLWEQSDELRLIRELVDDKHKTTVDDVLQHANVAVEAMSNGSQSDKSPCLWFIFLSVLILAQ